MLGHAQWPKNHVQLSNNSSQNHWVPSPALTVHCSWACDASRKKAQTGYQQPPIFIRNCIPVLLFDDFIYSSAALRLQSQLKISSIRSSFDSIVNFIKRARVNEYIVTCQWGNGLNGFYCAPLIRGFLLSPGLTKVIGELNSVEVVQQRYPIRQWRMGALSQSHATVFRLFPSFTTSIVRRKKIGTILQVSLNSKFSNWHVLLSDVRIAGAYAGHQCPHIGIYTAIETN